MRTMPGTLTCCSVLLIAAACANNGHIAPDHAPQVVEAQSTKPTVTSLPIASPRHILFVGNSYLYYNDSLHNHLKRMVDAAGIATEEELTYKSATVGGAQLRDHNITHLLDPSSLRVSKPFEIVVLQEGSSAALSEQGRQRFLLTATDYAAKIRAAGGEPVLYMTHAYAEPHKDASPGLSYEVAELYVETGNAIGAMVIPVGLAFEEAYRRRPEIKLHQTFDGSHPDLLGTYLAAATALASLYGVSPVGNPYDYFGEVSREDALFLQQVAEATVIKFYGRNR